MSRYEGCPSCGSNKMQVTTIVAGNSQESTQMKGRLEDPVGGQREREILVQEQKQLMIEELCGRDMGKRTFTITPTDQFSPNPIDLAVIIKNAEVIGYKIKTKGNLGVTAVSNNNGNLRDNVNSAALSVSFLTSGAATIVGAKSEQEALDIYRDFVDVKKMK